MFSYFSTLVLTAAVSVSSPFSAHPSPNHAPILPQEATTTTLAQASIGWSTTAEAYRGQNGQQFQFYCPPGGIAYSVWGTGTYTDDSSICTAAVHAGLIRLGAGGTVTLQVAPGQRSYSGSSRNGTTSGRWDSWHGSFIFPDAAASSNNVSTLSWSSTAELYRGQNGQQFTFYCPPNGAYYSIWGTDVYTDDSSICTAAVHAGQIAASRGGNVTIQISGGLSGYRPSQRYGVSSDSWGSWDGSFVFVH